MKKIFLIITMLYMTIAAFAQKLPADKITGQWLSEDGEDVQLKFEIFKSDGKYAGKLLWASSMFEADGKTPKKDFKNPDAKLRSRSRQGIVNIKGLTYEDGEYADGKLYNPENGSTYSLTVRLINANEMEFRGYMGISLLGKTMKFKRVQ